MTKTELVELLKDALSMAFFADYHLQHKADEINLKIDKFFRELKEEKENLK